MAKQISLKAARVNANMRQTDVACALGVSRSTIIAWESGRHSPPADKAAEMSALYDVPMGDISFAPKVHFK